MKRRKIWTNLSTAVLIATPAATQAAASPAQLAFAIEARADECLVQLAQHQGHGGAAMPATRDGEGEGGAAELPASLHLARGIAMIRGHLLIGGELIEAGRWKEALPHFLHPEEEIYASLRNDLKAYGVGPFQTTLKALSQTVKAKNKEAYARARATLEERLAAAESAVLAKEENKPYFVLETALETLQQASDEYEEAVENGRIANVVEYQDARGFVYEVDRLVGAVADALAAKDAEAMKALRASLSDLKATFPTPMPPQKAVKDAGEFLSAVSKFELQLGKFR
ncbi:hypothetical protein [Microvirga arsenatis]|uniref:Uncharacterized protein n=1 Tax=Microvirga arsenatis TaxID=2692265 RepID=A0ABW9Z2U7_9HYPH|nr:hypothetical protein [Microvirga arsenatis]NBJ13027.1 hypothetical protein [Microvirga arsenatis]NBJ26750.1 hypothetical protein [Microvirga arsenatis]